MLVIVGLIVAFILIAVFSNRATRLCRWRERRRDGDSLWHCAYCGAETQAPRGQEPELCLRNNS